MIRGDTACQTQRVTFLRGLPKLLQDRSRSPSWQPDWHSMQDTKSPLCSQRVMRERAWLPDVEKRDQGPMVVCDFSAMQTSKGSRNGKSCCKLYDSQHRKKMGNTENNVGFLVGKSANSQIKCSLFARRSCHGFAARAPRWQRISWWSLDGRLGGLKVEDLRKTMKNAESQVWFE